MSNTIYPQKIVEFCKQNYPSEFYGPSAPIRLQDDGQGIFIAAWPESLPAPPTLEELDAWTPSPVPAVEAMLLDREEIAKAKILKLKAKAAVLLVAGGMSESDTMAAGSQLVLDHAAKIQAYILAGGNPVAGQALIDEIVANPPAWWSPAIATIFDETL